MRAGLKALLLGLATGAAGCGAGPDPAELVLTGGRIWIGPATPLEGPGVPTALAIRGGRVVAVGSDAEIEALVGPGTQRIPLEGRRVVPGFIDNHVHTITGGASLTQVQLRDAGTPEEFIRRIAEFAAEKPGHWISGGAWDHENWGGELPRRDWIDSVTHETPVFVQRLDGHMGLANSEALSLAGITAASAEVEGGTIERDPDGRPTGILRDAAMLLVDDVIPSATAEELDEAVAASTAHAAMYGVTTLTEMSGSWAVLDAFRRAHANGRLPIRVYNAAPLSAWRELADLIAREEGWGDDRLFWGGLKAFVDGSLGSTTAWFHEPYTDAPETRGLIVTDTAELRRDIGSADSAGLHVIVHAIGDRANDWLLDVYREIQEKNGPRDRRLRIEHAQHLTTESIGRFGAEEVIPSMQPYHAIDDGRWAERRIGPRRIETTYAFRSLLDAGARVAFGSDWPVAPIDPLVGIHAAVLRQTIDGTNPDGWVPAEKVSVEEAVTAYTVDGAYAIYREADLGTLEPGKYADLVVLSADIFALPPESIETTHVDITIVAGEIVYDKATSPP